MYYRENDIPIENYNFPNKKKIKTKEHFKFDKKFPLWLPILLGLLVLVVLGYLIIPLLKKQSRKRKNIQSFGYRFY